MNNSQLTPEQAELLHKLSSKNMSLFETGSLLISMLGLPLPIEWRMKIYFFVNSLHNNPVGLINFTLITLFSVIGIFIVIKAIAIGIKILLLKRQLRNQNTVLLEIKPPHISLQSAYSTKELLTILHNLASPKSFWDRFFQKRTSYSLELVASKTEGIRYLVQVPEEEKDIVRKAFLSFMPDLKIKEAEDYVKQDSKWKITEYKQSNDFAYPLQSQKTLKEHDPIAYITGNMTKLSDNELISLQLVVTPATKKINEKANRIITAILDDGNVFSEISKNTGFWFLRIPFFILKLYLFIQLCFITVPFGMLQLIISNGAYGNLFPHKGLIVSDKKKYTYNTHQKEIVEEIKQKLDQSLFEVSIKTLSVLESATTQKEREKGFNASLSPFSNPGWQSLRAHKPLLSFNRVLFTFFKQFPLTLFKSRARFFSIPSIFSVSELSDLYHFPFSNTTKTENIAKVHSKELPAPISLKSDENFDVVFAKNTYGDSETMIGLAEDERRRHMYIIGATGSGKSTLLLSMIYQDIQNGKGICVIDPHGELAQTVIACIPKSRKDDFIYINPDDLEYPIGLNLLEPTPGLSENDQLREKEFITESVISLFRKVFSDAWSAHGHRIEYILRNTIHTAFSVENATLFTLYDLLSDPDFRKEVTNKLKDERLKKFWKNEFGKAGDFQRVKMTAGITSKIGRFLFSPAAKRILEQQISTINFDEMLNSGKIVVCNLAKGNLGEDTSEVLGIMILNKIQLAALKRARMESKQRRDFYVYVDEFQNFATPSFIQMLSEARKYKINMILAEQSTSQQKDKNLVNIIVANVGTVVSFRTANPEDEKLMLGYFNPYVEKGEIFNLPAYRFYMKISALNPEEPFSGETMVLDIKEDKSRVEELIKSSRDNFATLYVPLIEPKETKEPKPKPKTIKTVTSKTNGVSKPKSKQDIAPKTSKPKSKDFLPEFA